MVHFLVIFLLFVCIPILSYMLHICISRKCIQKNIFYLLFDVVFSSVLSYIVFHYVFRIVTFNYSKFHVFLYTVLNLFFSYFFLFRFIDKENCRIQKFRLFFQNLSNIKWLIFCFFILLALMMAVSYKMLYEPWIMVEDGRVFLNQQFEYGLKAIFDSYGGYCILISRLTAFISAHLGAMANSIVWAVMAMKWITILFEIIIINYFNDDDFSWLIPSRFLRLFVSVLIMFMMGNFQFFFYNTTSSHWFCGLLCFFVGVSLLCKKMPKMYIMPFLIISILSSPSSLVIVFAMIYYYFAHFNKKSFILGTIKNIGIIQFIKFFMIGLSLVLQVLFILFNGNGNTMASTDVSLLSNFISSLLLALQTPEYVLGVSVAILNNDFAVSTLIGIVIFVFVGVISYKSNYFKHFLYSFISILCLYFLTLFKNSDSGYCMYLYNNKHWLYNALPATIALFIILISCYKLFCEMKWKNIFILYFVFFVFICQHLYYYSFEFTSYVWNIEKYVDFDSSYYESIPIFPGGEEWYLNVPVSEN